MSLEKHEQQQWECVDLHCGGEPARILMSSLPALEILGQTMEEKRKYFMENFDHIREILLLEPRGYPCQNLNVIVPPTIPGADAGYIIAEQKKIYPLFSGHNTVCTATALIEMGVHKMTEPETHLALEAPGGLIKIRAECAAGRVQRIWMTSMPSFLEKENVEVDVPEVGKVMVDIAFGGMWYVIVPVKQLGIEIKPENGKKLARIGEMIKVAAREQHPVDHPTLHYPGPDILVFRTDPVRDGQRVLSRNTVVMSNKELVWGDADTYSGMLDRSPCGSGTAAVMASLFKKGLLEVGDTFVHSSILGTEFHAKIVEVKEIEGGRHAIVPEIGGRAFVTSTSTQILQQDDPLPTGFTVGDIW